ncbi:MAG: OmpA family protein, partial [Bdellovibrionota bacterium]
ATLVIASACASTPGIQEYPATANAREEVLKLATDIQSAEGYQFEVLAPTSFKKANEAFADAKLSLEKQKPDKATLHLVAESRAHLNRSTTSVKQVTELLPDVIVARQQALTAGARETLSVEMKKADSRLKDITSDIENNDTKDAVSERSAMQTAYLDLELLSIKRAKLSATRNTVAKAIEEGAKKHAPRSLAIAEKSLQDADSFITGNRHASVRIDEFAAKSQKSADHALKITRDAKSGKKVSAEDMALRVEKGENQVIARDGQLMAQTAKLDMMSDEMAKADAENQALTAENVDNQSELARGEGANVALAAANAAQAGVIAKGNSANEALSAKNSDMQAEQTMNRRFETARKQFTSQEAEVYKQGKTLMIRLRGLEFPTSQAVLKGSNFPLLAKVQRVIADFESSSVVVEGHTDSTGSKARNEKLSTERAQAVSTYLSSNLSGQKVEIESVGFGDQKPLSSNSTPKGRAQNRRVDVLIQQGPAKAL